MENWICVTCGMQYPKSETPPAECPICLDQRQYVGYGGQKWTTLAAMKTEGYHQVVREHEPGLIGIGCEPSFAIGQRPLLVQTGEGNVLWDCMAFLDDEIAATIQQLDGLKAIAISHPHYYTTMVVWAQRFDVPIYLHESDRQWVMRPDEHIVFWSGEARPLIGGTTLIRLGGHFRGGQVLHWPDGAEGKGVVLAGDIIQVVSDRNWVSFMYSYPNLIPLPASEVARIRATIAQYQFERLYGAWFDREVKADARNAVMRSADRYILALESPLS